MMRLDLGGASRKTFENALLNPYKLHVRVRLQNLSGDDLSDVSERLMDGQVNIDTSQQTTRQASLTINDPNTALNLDSDQAEDGAFYVDRMIRIDYRVWTEALDRWVSVPVFTGPVTEMTRNGTDVELSCLGKEYLAQAQAWHPMSFKQGHDVLDAIRAILRERAGETRFDFPDLERRPKIPQKHGISIGRMQTPWSVATRLARSINMQLFYNGAGVCTMRREPSQVQYTFSDGSDGRTPSVVSDASVSFDLSDVKNTIWLVGGKGSGTAAAKHPVNVVVSAARSNALSPWRLGRDLRDGTHVPRHLVEKVENAHVKTKKRARQVAKRRLARSIVEGVTVSFDALPIPHLEPLDMLQLTTELTSVQFTLRQASIPLTHDGAMSIGVTKRVGRIRRKHIR